MSAMSALVVALVATLHTRYPMDTEFEAMANAAVAGISERLSDHHRAQGDGCDSAGEFSFDASTETGALSEYLLTTYPRDKVMAQHLEDFAAKLTGELIPAATKTHASACKAQFLEQVARERKRTAAVVGALASDGSGIVLTPAEFLAHLHPRWRLLREPTGPVHTRVGRPQAGVAWTLDLINMAPIHYTRLETDTEDLIWLKLYVNARHLALEYATCHVPATSSTAQVHHMWATDRNQTRWLDDSVVLVAFHARACMDPVSRLLTVRLVGREVVGGDAEEEGGAEEPMGKGAGVIVAGIEHGDGKSCGFGLSCDIGEFVAPSTWAWNQQGAIGVDYSRHQTFSLDDDRGNVGVAVPNGTISPIHAIVQDRYIVFTTTDSILVHVFDLHGTNETGNATPRFSRSFGFGGQLRMDPYRTLAPIAAGDGALTICDPILAKSYNGVLCVVRGTNETSVRCEERGFYGTATTGLRRRSNDRKEYQTIGDAFTVGDPGETGVSIRPSSGSPLSQPGSQFIASVFRHPGAADVAHAVFLGLRGEIRVASATDPLLGRMVPAGSVVLLYQHSQELWLFSVTEKGVVEVWSAAGPPFTRIATFKLSCTCIRVIELGRGRLAFQCSPNNVSVWTYTETTPVVAFEHELTAVLPGCDSHVSSLSDGTLVCSTVDGRAFTVYW